MKISVVLPAKNEAAAIGQTIEKINNFNIDKMKLLL
jgi:glycosyltransferase involved in cell wall biosynthesis